MIVLAGGKVTSAGIIVVKDGIVKSLSPLSGHYRSSIDVSAPLFSDLFFLSAYSRFSSCLVLVVTAGVYKTDAQHYRSFIGQLEQKGVDLSHVKIAKSVLVSAARLLL
jgi:hypothetical protein